MRSLRLTGRRRCFKCKCHGHHVDQTCEERMKMEIDQDDGIQMCPNCGVPTVKIEGCNHIICVCGEEWYWEGDDY